MRKRQSYRSAILPGILLIIVVLAGVLAYQIPSLQSRIAWRIDRTLTYLHGVLYPVGPIPTASDLRSGSKPNPRVYVTHQPETTTLLEETTTPVPTMNSGPTNTPAPTRTPTLSPTPIPLSINFPAPKWEKQDINNCGPATLAMYLRFYGWDGDQKAIADLLKPHREDRNVNVEELVYYVRTRVGWLNIEYRVGGDLDMLKRLMAAGIPVMIEESFHMDESYWPSDDRWAAHYLLVTGYNDANQTFIGQDSFRGPNQIISYKQLDDYWQSFNRVYIMIYRPEQEPSVQSVLGPQWDIDFNRQHALDVARSETEAHPDNAYAWFNLGTNLTYFDRNFDATDAYDVARNVGLPQRMLRYQFGPFMAYFHSGRIEDVLALTKYALLRTANSEEALLWQGWALYRQGKLADAIDSFQKALKEHPNYPDAQYALDFVTGNR